MQFDYKGMIQLLKNLSLAEDRLELLLSEYLVLLHDFHGI